MSRIPLRKAFSWTNLEPLEATEEDAPPREQPLAPTDSVAGRSVVIVIAIMTFLAALAAGAALLVADASVDWRKEVAREASVQVRSLPGRDIDADVRAAARIIEATPGVKEARIYTKAESEALLSPWLGKGLDLTELPTPRMIVVRLDVTKRTDLARLKQDLAAGAPYATLDDHRLWVERLDAMAGTVVGTAALIFALVVVAMAVAVASATRAAVATNREIVEVLHIVGAADDFIAREFQRRFLALGLRGALIGGGGAALFFLVAGLLARRWTATPGGDEIEAMFGSASLDARGFAVIMALSLAVAALTGVMSRLIVLRRLKELN
ncbi:cell division protein FtsX [Methylocystis heyeri]|uniref:ABC transporter permease n=1 Tax=Methylocystis heyeri TaxID=391905 RepID=A0A6B8KB78_9HYPH|nr:ABC transporter permease [Methylocystis heyeri]QGM45386.1 ABC transporter permease [Methylocystis heyeri]